MMSPVPLKQIVPQALCLSCEVCCRFPEETSVLAPFFMAHEIVQAGHHTAPHFASLDGARIRLQPHGEGCLCPFFDPETHFCQIYTHRPLDCQLYPFALMRNPDGMVVLGIDTKCPYIVEHAHDAQMMRDAEAVRQVIESEPILTQIAQHPALIGPFQQDVTVLYPLTVIHARLSGAPTLHG